VPAGTARANSKLIGGISPVDENDFPYSNRFGGAKHKNILLRENCALAQNNSKTPGYVTLLLASPHQGRGSIIGRQAERGEWTVSMRWKLEASLFCVKGSAHFKRLALVRR
jgi:hypothetical protein